MLSNTRLFNNNQNQINNNSSTATTTTTSTTTVNDKFNHLKNYLILPNEFHKINPNTKTNNSYQTYDVDYCKTAYSNNDISIYTVNQNNPDALIWVDQNEVNKTITYRLDTSIHYDGQQGNSHDLFRTVNIPTYCKPVACYLSLIETKQIDSNNTSLDIDYNKGSVTLNSVPQLISSSIGSAIIQMDSHNNVSTGYSSYDNQFGQTTQDRNMNYPGQGTYNNYQNVLLYQFKISVVSGRVPPVSQTKLFIDQLLLGGLKTKFYFSNTGDIYYYIEMFRCDPFTKDYSSNLYQTFTKDQVSDLCFKKI